MRWLQLKGYIQFSQSCLTLCDPMDCSTSGLPVHHQFPEFTQTHVHWVGDAIQPSHPLSSHLQSIPASGSFPMSQFFTSGGQSIGVSASASALPMNVQDWVSSPPPEDLPNPGIKPISCLLLTNYSTQIKDDDKSCYSTPMKTLMPRPLSIQQHGKKHSRSTSLRTKID